MKDYQINFNLERKFSEIFFCRWAFEIITKEFVLFSNNTI